MSSTFVPLGIKSFDNKFENKYISLSYTLSDNAQEVTLQIRDGEEEIYKKVITSPSEVSKGQHFWSWDGFDKNGILDTARLTKAKRLNYKISVKRKNNIFSETQYFKISYSEVNWVDVKINRPKKEIYVTLRVNLRDGGAEGLKGFRIQQTSSFGTYTNIEIDPPRDVPAAILKKWGHPPITSRTRSYENLRDLVLEGITYHWSRNKLPTSNIATGVNITGQDYEVFVDAINTTENAMNSVKLIFNTNSEWGRSGNPGAFARIFYNVGYLKYSDGWGYQSQLDADRDFEETSAHEIGHTILESYGNTVYSWQHRGSSYFLLQDAKPTPDSDSWEKMKEQYTHIDFYAINKMSYTFGEYYPSTGEIDLMKYYHTRNPKGDIVAYPDKTRTVASEKDVLGLLWLTKMNIIK